ncbi:hypothetical protein GQ57_32300 [Burkholderia sp. MSh2]|nr:hypothetical protein GQ57_32300 [Burkholderia sp. MSh2]
MSSIYRWLCASGERCIWLGLDERERDIRAVFALLRRGMAGSAAKADDPSAETAGGFTDSIEMTDPGHALQAIVGDLRRLPGRTVIFIDNLDACADPMIPAFIENLTFHRAPNVHLVVSSVRNLPIDLVRMKLEVDGLLLGTAELGFDRNETRQLFALAGFARLDDSTLLDIHAHTEGWPAAVRLAQVLMSEQKQFRSAFSPAQIPPAPLHGFSGDQRDISRVLTDRVLAIIDPARVRFLLEIALVREFNADLAEFMTGNVDTRDWLNDLLQRNLLIFEVGGRHRWFRFHTLLREYFLQEAKERIGRDRRTALLKRASSWHAEHKDYVGALGYALEAPDIEQAERLIGRIARNVAADCGQMSKFVTWAETLLELGGRLPIQAQGWYVWALCHLMQYEKAKSAFQMLDQRIAESLPFPPAPLDTADLHFLGIVLAVATDELETAHAQALSWLDHVEHHDPLHVGTVAAAAAMVAVNRGDLDECERHLDVAEGAIERSGSMFVRAWVAILRAILELSRARPDSAARILGPMRARVAAEIDANASILAIIDSVHARALVDLGQFSDAQMLIERSMQIANHHGIALTAELGLGACVACATESERGRATDAALGEIARRYAPRVMDALSAQRMRVRLHSDSEADTTAFVQGVAQAGTRPAGKEMHERGDRLLAGIELTIARGLLKDAHKAIEAAMKRATTQGRTNDRVSLLLAAMDAFSREGRAREAARALSRAIGLAHAGSLVYPFILYRRAVRKIIENTGARDFGLIRPNEIDFLARLHEICGQYPNGNDTDSAHPADTSMESIDPVQPLTERETELLLLVNEGFSNQTLADQLSISLPTVKWHLRNLYGKLGVRSRSAALAKARAYGLLA